MPVREVNDVRYDFSGRVVLVTGAARGQGRSHALAFAGAGADVVVCDIAGPVDGVPYPLSGEAELDGVVKGVEASGVNCMKARCDVTDGAAVDAMVAEAIERFGKIDILINNAGVTSIVAFEDMTDSAWNTVVNSQLTAAMHCTRAVSPHMIERNSGRILITGSVQSFIGLQKNAHYVAAKHGLLGLARALAIELAPHGIGVNLVCPGGVETEMAEGMREADPAWLQRAGELTGAWNLLPPGGNLDPEEITHAMMWLASDASHYVTGAALVVDGGFTLT